MRDFMATTKPDDEDVGITVHNEKIYPLWAATCEAELALYEGVMKLPRATKKCNCEDETVSFEFATGPEPKIKTGSILKQLDSIEPETRCLECGGKV